MFHDKLPLEEYYEPTEATYWTFVENFMRIKFFKPHLSMWFCLENINFSKYAAGVKIFKKLQITTKR